MAFSYAYMHEQFDTFYDDIPYPYHTAHPNIKQFPIETCSKVLQIQKLIDVKFIQCTEHNCKIVMTNGIIYDCDGLKSQY